MKRGLVLGAILTAALSGAGCGENLNATPVGPTAPQQSPFSAQFGGMWTGAMTLTGVRGGECVGADMATSVGVGDIGTVTITQDVGKVTAISRSATTGLTCQYEGTSSLASFAVSATSCQARTILYQCSTGASRVLELVGETITGSISGNTVRGTVASTYNVYAESEEDQQRKPVAGLILQQGFAATRR